MGQALEAEKVKSSELSIELDQLKRNQDVVRLKAQESAADKYKVLCCKCCGCVVTLVILH